MPTGQPDLSQQSVAVWMWASVVSPLAHFPRQGISFQGISKRSAFPGQEAELPLGPWAWSVHCGASSPVDKG